MIQKTFYFIPSIEAFNIHILPFVLENNGEHVILYTNGDEKKYHHHLVKFINILNYSNSNYYDFLKDSKVNAFILFNIFSIMDIFFIQLCKSLNIRTFYIQHGVRIDYNDIDGTRIFLNRGSSSYIYNIAIRKYFRFVYLYLQNFRYFINKRQIAGYFLQYLKNILNLVKMTFPDKGYKKLSVCDHAFVYSNYDSSFIIENFCYDEKQITVMGLPLKKLPQTLTHNKQKKILLISSNLKSDGIVKEEDENYLFNQIFQRFNNHYSIIFKLHPQENKKKIKEYFINSIKPLITQKSDPVKLVVESDLVICFFSSTLLLNAVKLNKPIVFIRLPNVEFNLQDAFGFVNMGIGKCIDIDFLRDSVNLDDLFYIDYEKYREFEDKYIGPDNFNYPMNIIDQINEKI